MLAVACGSSSKPTPPPATTTTLDLQILTVSTWLGQLDPISETDSAGNAHNYGGLGVLSTYFKNDRATNPNTLTLFSADSFGASPPLSALTQPADEPAILGESFLGVQADALGNHAFDRGISGLKPLVDLATFSFVATNLEQITPALGSKIAVPYKMFEVGPAGGTIKVAVIGLTDPVAPTKVFPGQFGSITVEEPVAAANQAAADARKAGANVVVALTDFETTSVDASGNHQGGLVELAKGLSGIDVTFGYQASTPSIYMVGDTLVAENRWKGRTYSRVKLHVERGVVTATAGEVVEPDGAKVTADPAAETLLAPYRQKLADVFDKVIGTSSAELVRDGTERTQEVPLGDLIADAFLAKYKPIGAQLAIMHGGGIRASLPSSYAPIDKTLRRTAPGYAAGPPYDLVAGDVYTVLPFGDLAVVRQVSGETLWAALESSVSMAPTSAPRFLQIAGFKFTYKESATPGARLQSVTLDDGTPILKDKTQYTLVLPDILESGSDGYTMLVEPKETAGRDVMADVLLAYVQARKTIAPSAGGRITKLP